MSCRAIRNENPRHGRFGFFSPSGRRDRSGFGWRGDRERGGPGVDERCERRMGEANANPAFSGVFLPLTEHKRHYRTLCRR